MDVLSVLSTITSLSNFILPRCYWRSFELRIRISISPGKLTLIPRVRNIDSKAFSFMFALRNYLYVSDIRCVFLSNFFAPDFLLLYCFLSLSDILCGYRTCSEVRVEGLETLDYLDNLIGKERFTEQADAITFDGEVSNVSHCKVFKEEKNPTEWCRVSAVQVDRVYLNTPTKIAVIDHERKRTIELRKEGMPNAGKGYHIYMFFTFFGMKRFESWFSNGWVGNEQLCGTPGTKRQRP